METDRGRRLKRIAFDFRLDVLDMVFTAGTGHIGGSMSCMDILTALYFEAMDSNKILTGSPVRDRFILSKGHCAEALYAVLSGKGIIAREALKTYAAFDTALAEHPTKKIFGVEAVTGSLGHGLSIGVGLGIGLKADKFKSRVFVLTGDGELAEGSVWEAMMSAAKYKLDNLTMIVDRNRLQISGDTEETMPLENLKDKLEAFGWECRRCNGHEPEEIIAALNRTEPNGKPLAVIAETIKGFGSVVMENKADWHHRIPDETQYAQIKSDLLRGRDSLG